jgi:transposase InsO family protein
VIEQEIILQMVKEVRDKLPVAGVRMLYIKLKDDMNRMGIKLGRDGLFDLLRSENMLIKRRKRRIWTTNSNHGLRVYPNLLSDIDINRPNQVWVSDITYWRVGEDFVYISLITDAYSKKILGYNVAKTLEGINALKALKMAIAQAPFPLRHIIHHSDRGIQYCSKKYVKILQKNHFKISMAAKGNPLENPVAERINGTIKNDFLYHYKVQNLSEAREALQKTIRIYNNERPHSSVENLTPFQAHQKTDGNLKNMWKPNKFCNPISGPNNECKLIPGLYVKPVPQGCLRA